MDRHVSRRTVSKLGYAAPLVAASMAVGNGVVSAAGCPPGETLCQCLDGDRLGFSYGVGGAVNDVFPCGSCHPAVATGTGCLGRFLYAYHSGDADCRDPLNIVTGGGFGIYVPRDICTPALREACLYCGPGDLISQPFSAGHN